MVRATAARSWRTTLAVVLACALLSFTTVYRNGGGFQAATAARCHSLSTDHTSSRTLFAGDFGPLAVVTDNTLLLAPAPAPDPAPRVDLDAPAPKRLLALVTTPFRRPPPPIV